MLRCSHLDTSRWSAGPSFAADPTGTWLTKDADARVRVATCGRGTYCGTIGAESSVGIKRAIH